MVDAPPTLRFVSDAAPGFSRRRSGRGFSFLRADGRQVRDAATIDRINKLAIPPAWTDVWICPDAHGHLQASGRDAKGRKQYRYHADFRAWRDTTKFEHMAEFGRTLPALRRRINGDRRRKGLPRAKVLATLVYLLDVSLIRIGNDEYAEKNKTFGLTTLRNRHVSIAGEQIRFVFKGKSGKQWNVRLKDRRVARVLRELQDLHGQHLFQYVDDGGQAQPISSGDVNDYLREIAGRDVTAKDFRTWAATVLAAGLLTRCNAPTSPTAAKRMAREMVIDVAKRLGNTPTVCRQCYIHPHLFVLFESGDLAGMTRASARKGLSADEDLALSLVTPSPRQRRAKTKAGCVQKMSAEAREYAHP